jgi:glycosyltransferase involved in cell wall biosynthesis
MLTVLMATRNGGARLSRVLCAYLRLQPPSGGWKLVVVDNASDDGSAGVARSFGDRLPLECVAEPVPGKNRALNRGLRALEGDLAIFADDDGLPEPNWLVEYRRVADGRPEYDAFGGAIRPLWIEQPADWIPHWVRLGPVYGVTDPLLADGPCDPTRIWGPNMALRSRLFHEGHRFDDGLGPDGSATYAMGGETELVLRLTIAENVKCWHCSAARVAHIVRPETLRCGWILKRAFRLGRCLYRETEQKRAAGQNADRRDPATMQARLAGALAALASARSSGDPRRVFEARWQVNLCIGSLFEAARANRASRISHVDACLEH